MAQSLFTACKNVIKEMASSTQNIGGYDVPIEYFTQDTLEAGTFSLGNSTQNSVVLLTGNELTIPSGKTLTTASYKKSLVIMCNTLNNNGTISMTAKAPNVLPHNWHIFGKTDGFLIRTNAVTGEQEIYMDDIIIPAYANNAVAASSASYNAIKGKAGNNGSNRNCGSGGTGYTAYNGSGKTYSGASGSGYAFGGGAGSGGVYHTTALNVNSTYPMRGSNGAVYLVTTSAYDYAAGGVGNPSGTAYYSNASTTTAWGTQSSGCGGRIIIYCNEFVNNGSIITNGTAASLTKNDSSFCPGGSSGAGAIDIFYTTLTTKGTTTANGGARCYSPYDTSYYGGAGGNGSITFTPWNITKVVKDEVKYFSTANIAYLLTQFTERINNSHIGE